MLLQDLPRNAAVRRVNELVKRARMARVHALIVGHLKNEMPFFGAAGKQKQLLENLADEFFKVMQKHRLPQGDFPNLQRFKEVASTYDFTKFKKLDDKMMAAVDAALSDGTRGIPALLKQLAEEQDAKAAVDRSQAAALLGMGVGSPAQMAFSAEPAADPSAAAARGGAGGGAGGAASTGNPFGGSGIGGKDAYAYWAALVNKVDADTIFKLLPGGQEGLVSGAGARDVLLESGLDTAALRGIWDLSDIDKDGYLDRDEFAVCWYLIHQAKAGNMPPAELPPLIVPPTKRAAPAS